MDGGAWLMTIFSFFRRYPEIILAIASFFLTRSALNLMNQLLVDWPFVGMLPSLFLNFNHIHDWGTSLLKKSGGTIFFKGSWFLRMNFLITCDPANVNHILTTNFPNYPRGSDFTEIFNVFGDGITNVDSEEWKLQRKMLHSFFSQKRYKQLVRMTCQKKLENGLMPVVHQIATQGRSVDLQDVIKRFMFDTTCTMVYGVDPGSLSLEFPTVPFSKALDEVEVAIFFRHALPKALWKIQKWLRIGEEKKFANACKAIDEFVYHRISERKKEQKKKDDDGEATDVLTSYMGYQLGDEVSSYGPDYRSDKFFRDSTLSIMLAGKNTTSAALTWFFWLLSKNPRVEIKIFHELITVFSRKSDGVENKARVLDYEQVGGLVYLHAALCESMRLYPPAFIGHKAALRPDTLPSGEQVQPGTKILYYSYAMGRMESVWGKECMEFKPERWISENGEFKSEPSYKFLAFHSGPRSCMGKDLGLYQMKAIASAILYNFHVQVVEGQIVSPEHSIILLIKDGLMVNISKRPVSSTQSTAIQV